jgi:uncharacterized protein (TIGR00369 family)
MEALNHTASDTTITELMIPSYANFGGKIHGGILLSLMDKVAYACATKHAGNYCVTVSVDEVEFLEPVEVGDLVSMMARVNYVGNTSLVVGIKVTAENVKKRLVKHTNTCYFTMVAKGEDDKPAQVPPLKLTTKLAMKRFSEAMLRKDLKRQHKVRVEEAKRSEAGLDLFSLLENERCEIVLEA